MMINTVTTISDLTVDTRHETSRQTFKIAAHDLEQQSMWQLDET